MTKLHTAISLIAELYPGVFSMSTLTYIECQVILFGYEDVYTCLVADIVSKHKIAGTPYYCIYYRCRHLEDHQNSDKHISIRSLTKA